ncbi:hypothetical protein PMAYCL1PPCAC_02076 [Pristionchus mayeri]|uniref:Protein kinase domain-containing protein n=1 Tax=Pristionchus mayeri TaxID=1317129 RepID=A0AAN5C822_9BILA|nr:hypothetical protein PMAYCL1PPCAC_02076 [Pristionchus mayeri]
MNQSSSSATHDSNNSENNENDDWERIGDGRSADDLLVNYREIMSRMSKEELEKFVRERSPIHHNMAQAAFSKVAMSMGGVAGLPSPLHPHSHTCNSCSANGGPSFDHHQTSTTAAPYPNSSGGYSLFSPMYPSSYPAVPGPPLSSYSPHPMSYSPSGVTNPLFYWGPEWNRLMQIQAALAKSSPGPHNLSQGIETRGGENASRQPFPEGASDELMNTLMKTLIAQCTDSPTSTVSSNGTAPSPPQPDSASLDSIPPSTSLPSTVPQVAPPPLPDVAQCSDLSLLMIYLRKLVQTQEYEVFRDLERKVIHAYGGKYLKSSVSPSTLPSTLPSTFPSSFPSSIPSVPSSVPSTATSSEYAQPSDHMRSATRNASGKMTNGVRSHSSSSPFSTPCSSSSILQSYYPVTPTEEQSRIISEAITYAQTRWPRGCSEGVCVSLGADKMPPSVPFSLFTQQLPHFISQFGEPLASFLTVLSCFVQEEMNKKSSCHSHLLADGVNGMERGGAPSYGVLLRRDIPENKLPFTKENDEKILGVMSDALRAISVGGERSVPAPPSMEKMAMMEAYYQRHGMESGGPSPPVPFNLPPNYDAAAVLAASLVSPSSPYPSSSLPLPPPLAAPLPPSEDSGNLLSISDEELYEMLRKEVPRCELSAEMERVLEAMDRVGVKPPPYTSPHDLINKLICYQYHYGVEAIPVHDPFFNPHQLAMSSMEEVNHSRATPPELMLIYPNAKKFRYHCCNALITDPRRRKKIEVLELSDDEESDEAGGLHSLPVSIKREYVLGMGSFGTVYEGCVVPLEKADPAEVDMESDDKKVAIKAINMSYFSKYPYLRKQLDYEVSTLRQCMGFPAIVQFEGFTESCSPFNTVSPCQHAFIVMELMGCNLEDYVSRQDPNRLSELHAKVIIRQIQAALNFLHCRGISHCDLKPSNILLNDKSTTLPHVKLCDFGHVRFYGDTISETDIAHQTGGLGVANNRGYRAPEHATALGFSPALDMYALGAVSYFIMTGFVPNLTAPRNPSANQTVVVQRTKKGKKNKKIEDDSPRLPTPSVASTVSECALGEMDERMLPEEQQYDLEEETHLWPYTSRQSYHFCREHMRIKPEERITLRDSMDHEWLSGFEMYSMLRRLECKMGLFKPSERHLTTVLDDVNYQRGMLYMASNPSFIAPFSSLSGGGDLSNGAAALMNLYAREGDYTHLYGPEMRDPPQTTPLSQPSPPTRTTPLAPPPSIPPSVSPIPVPLHEPANGKKPNGKTKKKAK